MDTSAPDTNLFPLGLQLKKCVCDHMCTYMCVCMHIPAHMCVHMYPCTFPPGPASSFFERIEKSGKIVK